jgi:hypothetical protein
VNKNKNSSVQNNLFIKSFRLINIKLNSPTKQQIYFKKFFYGFPSLAKGGIRESFIIITKNKLED